MPSTVPGIQYMLNKCTITVIILIGIMEIVLVKEQDWRLKIRFLTKRIRFEFWKNILSFR